MSINQLEKGSQSEFLLYAEIDSEGNILDVRAKKKGNWATQIFREAWHNLRGLKRFNDRSLFIEKIKNFMEQTKEDTDRMSQAYNKLYQRIYRTAPFPV